MQARLSPQAQFMGNQFGQPRIVSVERSLSPPAPQTVASNTQVIRRPSPEGNIPINLNNATTVPLTQQRPQFLSPQPMQGLPVGAIPMGSPVMRPVGMNAGGIPVGGAQMGMPIGGTQLGGIPVGARMPIGGIPVGGSNPFGGGIPIGNPVPLNGPIPSPNMQMGMPIGGQVGMVGINPMLGQPPFGQYGPPPNMLGGFGSPTTSMGLPPGAPFGYPHGIQFPNAAYLGFKPVQNTVPPPNINTKIQQDRVYCVLCQNDYAVSERDQHIKRHQKSNDGNNKIKKLMKEYKQEYQGPEVRPIVEPEQYNIQYNPNSYVIQKQTIYSSPQYQPLTPITRVDLGVGTTDPATVTYATPNANSTILQPPVLPNTYAPEGVRLTTDGQRISNYDPNSYQAARIMKQQPINNVQPAPIIPQNERFDRNTFISDEQVLPNQPSTLFNRQTLQSQQFRNSQLTNNPTKVSSAVPMMPTISEQPHIQVNKPVQNTGLPQGSLVQQPEIANGSKFQRNNNVNDYASTSKNPTLIPTVPPQQVAPQKLSSNYNSVMPQIKQESQHRQTITLDHDKVTNSNYIDQAKAQESAIKQRQYNQNDYYRQTATQPAGNIPPTDTNVARSTITTPVNNLANQSQIQNTQGSSIFDDFDHENSKIVIPRQSRTNIDAPSSSTIIQQPQPQPQIPFNQIIQQKSPTPNIVTQPTQSIVQTYQPQIQQPLDILQNTAQDLKKKKLPKNAGGWDS